MAKTKKKKNIWWIALILVILLLSTYSAFMYWRNLQQEEAAKFALYPAFGIELPLGYNIHGIDVSSYQNFIYWPLVKKMQVQDVKINFAFIKATEGLSGADKQFKRNWQQCKQAGITRGAYHYFLATKDGVAQAKNFISNVKLEPGDLPPVLDVEDLYGVPAALMQQRVKDFLQVVEAAYNVKPIVYSYADFFQRNLAGSCKGYPVWVAHYFGETSPHINCEWQFWQHSDAGKVNGITSKVDFNVFRGDSLSFANLLLK